MRTHHLPHAASGVDTASEYSQLWWHFYAPVFLFFIAAIYAAIVWVIFRYRRRAGDDGIPEQREEKPIVESLYAVFVAGVAAMLYFFTFQTESRVDAIAANPGLRVEIDAFQWQWKFTYPDAGIVVVGTRDRVPTLVVPAGTTVHYSIRSRDVIHSWWVPALRFKRDANPNWVNTFDLMARNPGRYPGRCSEYCGLRHTQMRFFLEARPPAAFERWVERNRGRTL